MEKSQLSQLKKDDLVKMIMNQHNAINSSEFESKLQKLEEQFNRRLADVISDFSSRVEALETTNDDLRGRISVLENRDLNHKEYYQTTTKNEFMRMKPTIIKETYEQIEKDKLKSLKPEIISESIKQFNQQNKQTFKEAQTKDKPDLVIYGMKEKENSSPKERFEDLKNELVGCINTLKATTEDTVTNYFRLGKFASNKTRPIGLKVNSIWTKRKLLAEYSKQKKEGKTIPFTLKEYIPVTPDFIKAKIRAKALNDELKEKNGFQECDVSYSARQDGSVIVYKKIDNKWRRTDEVLEKED